MNALATAELEVRKATVAKTAGIDSDRIHAVRIDMGRMLDEGMLVDIDLHGFGCLKTGVSWKELGMNTGDKRRDRIQKGQKLLTPATWAKKLKSLETRFRNSVSRWSFDVTVFRPWVWVPLTAWDAWKDDWDDLQADLETFKIQLKAALPAIVDENVAYFRTVARRAWESYRTPDDNSVVMTADGKVLVGYEEFEDDIVTNALAQMPSPADIDAISATYKTGLLMLPPSISAYYTEAEAELTEAAARARKAQAEADALETEVRKARWEQIDRERVAGAKLEAIRKAEYDRAMAELDSAMSPMREVMLRFRDQIYQDVVDIAASLKKNGTLVGRVGNKAKGLRDLYQLMASCTNDVELEAALGTLTAALSTADPDGGTYNAGAVEQALSGVVALTKDAADELRRMGSHSTVADFLEL